MLGVRKGGFGMTIHLNANCQAFEILKVVAIVGEFPLHRLGMLGNRRMYRATVARMTEEQTYLNDYTKETVTAKVLTIVGKGKRRGIRLLKGAETLLKWTNLYEYYDTIFGQNNFSGGEKHRDRNFKIAETLAMCRGAGFAYNPAHIPDLAEGSETLPVEFEEQPCFYTARAIKGDKDYEMKETVFTRATGAFFFNGQFTTLYNIGGDMAKLWENSEAKMKDNLFIINRNNGGGFLEKSPACIMFTENEMHVVNTLRYVYNKRANKHKDYTQSSFYRHVYAIPLSSDGMRILRLFHLGDWQEILARKICPKERGWLTTDNRFAVDNGKTFYYNFLDCDVASLLYMKKQMKKGTQVDAIVCFEHQIPFIQELFSKKINIRCFSIDTVEKILGLAPKKEEDVEEEDEQNGDT